MGQYQLFNKQIKFSDAEERMYDILYRASQASTKAVEEFQLWYNNCGDIQTILKNYKKQASDLVVKHANKPLFDELIPLEIYDVSEANYDEDCFSLKNSYDAFNEISSKYDDIIYEQEAAKEYREERKASRGRVVGGGYGVSGAVKGMATAGAMNAISGMGHSFVNAIGNAGSAITAATSKKALYSSNETYSLLSTAIHSDVFDSYFSHIDFINTIKENYYIFSFDIDKAMALFESAKKVEHKRIDLLLESFVKYPWNSDLLIFIFTTYKDERKNIWEIANRFNVDLSEVAENIFSELYHSRGKQSEKALQSVKAEILAEMQVLGISQSETINEIEKDGVRRILKSYDISSETARQTMFYELETYDASIENKAYIIREIGVWEIASKYSVKFNEEEAEKIISKIYTDTAKNSEDEALIAKSKIKQVMLALNITHSSTFDMLEKDSIRRLCQNYANADESTCNEMLSKIQAYDALDKNKQEFIKLIKLRIEAIWSTEDGEIFDNVYMNTNICDIKEINKSIEFIKQKVRTKDSQKYISALSACTAENINKARNFQKPFAKTFLYGGLIFIGIAIFLMFADLGIILSIATAGIGIVMLSYYCGLKKAWETLTFNGTIIHKTISLSGQEIDTRKKQ